ncbi:glycosyltransferase family 9 protein [bacterium]|nr:glycosyltransferase family 9 protein [bacterium]
MKRILVLNQNFIGDVIFTLPAIKTLKEGYQTTPIDVVLGANGAEVLKKNPWIDSIFVRPKRVEEKRELLKQIKTRNYDMCLSFSSKSVELALLSFLSGCKRRFGFFNPATFLFYNFTIKENPEDHCVLDYVKLAIAAGGRKSTLIPEIFLSEEETNRARELADALTKEANEPIFGILLGGSTTFKRWHLPTLNELLNMLKAKGNVFLFGGTEFEELGRTLEQEKIHNLAGHLSLRESIALLKFCSVFVGQDSGLTHIAACLGVPTLGIYTATDPKRTSPLGAKVRVLYKPISCSPCWSKKKCRKPICLKTLNAKEIGEEIEKLMVMENE